MKKHTDPCIPTLNTKQSVVAMTSSRTFTPNIQIKKFPTDLFPHLGIPTVWMMYTATWKKKTKKKKKKLKELSDLEGENRQHKGHVIDDV